MPLIHTVMMSNSSVIYARSAQRACATAICLRTHSAPQAAATAQGGSRHAAPAGKINSNNCSRGRLQRQHCSGSMRISSSPHSSCSSSCWPERAARASASCRLRQGRRLTGPGRPASAPSHPAQWTGTPATFRTDASVSNPEIHAGTCTAARSIYVATAEQQGNAS